MTETEKHCVFRKGRTWLGMPAIVVREVMPRPAFVSVPHTHRVLTGLCHIRSEFIPVLNLCCLLPAEHSGNEAFLLIVEDTDGDWGILVDEVIALASLEPSDAPEEIQSDWNQTIIGWATHREKLVRLIDHARFRQLAEWDMNDSWQRNLTESHVLSDDEFIDLDESEEETLSHQHAIVK